MNIEYIVIVAVVFSACNFIGFIAALIRLYSLDVEVNAMKKSTHKIQYMPIDPAWADSDRDVNKAFEADQGHPDDFKGL